MSSPVTVPIALSKATNKPVNIKDVPNGLNCNCYCGGCNEDLIAKNNEGNKKAAHFSHKPHSNCKFINFESYIHWLAKEVFKTLDSIKLPEINSWDFSFHTPAFNNLYKRISDCLKDGGLSEYAENYSKGNFNILLQNETELKIEKCEIEKNYKSKFGDVRIDTVLFNNDNPFFIEPFYTNSIDKNKLKKITDINISTLSINLVDYVAKNDFYFTIENFTSFLKNDLISKKWEFIRISKANSLTDNYINKTLSNKLNDLKDSIRHNDEIKKEIEKNNAKIIEYNEKVMKLHLNNKALEKNLKDIKIF